MEQAPGRRQLEAAAEIFTALADPQRLQILLRLAKGELNVTQLADSEKISTVSARLKVLRAAHLVKRRRDGQAILYAIADDRVSISSARRRSRRRSRGPKLRFYPPF
jgi:ArsR family transcriptional regulator